MIVQKTRIRAIAGIFAFVLSVRGVGSPPLLGIQELPHFSQVIEKWKSVSERPYYGQFIVEIDDSGGVQFPAKRTSETNLVGDSGFLTISRSEPDEFSFAHGISNSYLFSLRIPNDSPPLLSECLLKEEEIKLRKERKGSDHLLRAKHKKLLQHPALIIFDSFYWLDIVRSPGFSASLISEIPEKPGRCFFKFSCNPTAQEKGDFSGSWIPVLSNGRIEVACDSENYLPIEYAFEVSQRPGTERAFIKVRNEYEQMPDGELRLKAMERTRNYKGRIDTLKKSYQNISTKIPDESEFCVSRFGLPEPRHLVRKNIFVAWTICGFALVLLLCFCRFFPKRLAGGTSLSERDKGGRNR